MAFCEGVEDGPLEVADELELAVTDEPELVVADLVLEVLLGVSRSEDPYVEMTVWRVLCELTVCWMSW